MPKPDCRTDRRTAPHRSRPIADIALESIGLLDEIERDVVKALGDDAQELAFAVS